MDTRPKVKLTGLDGNIFILLGAAAKALERAGLREQAKALYRDVEANAHSYDEALAIIIRYVDAS